jgi:Ca-activated chloride channel family protein
VLTAIDALKAHGATAMGDALQLAIDAARAPVSDIVRGAHRLPAAIVLMSDGASTRGADPIDVVQKTKRYKIPIYTVALGTATGVLVHKDPRTGAVISTEKVPPDPLTLQDIARDTGGQFFAAPDARKLAAVYANLGTRLTHIKEQRQITAAFAGAALVLLLAGAGLSVLRAGWLP